MNSQLARMVLARFAQGLGVGLIFGASDYVRYLPLFADQDQPFYLGFNIFLSWSAHIGVLMALMGWAFHGLRPGPARWTGMALAIAFAVGPFSVFRMMHTTRSNFRELIANDLSMVLHMAWGTLAIGVLAWGYLAVGERAAAARERLRRAQREREEAERDVLHSRLNVIRARVEPRFLFDALQCARAMYRDGIDDAERLLDELIAFLRAALPQSVAAASTLDAEAYLVASYLRVESILRDRPIGFSLSAAEDIGRSFFPPMVLLPLVREMVAGMQPGDAAAELRISAWRDGGSMAIEIDGFGAPRRHPDIEEPASTLRAFFGPSAWIRSEGSSGRVKTALRFPVEATAALAA